MMDIIGLENKLIEKIEGLRSDIEAIQQPRSDFAIEHFVVGQHDTPGRQRMQAVLELQIKMFNIRRAQLEEKKLLVERRKQEKISITNGDEFEQELAAIEIERIDIDLADMRLARTGAIRESQCMLAILDRLPRYSYAQLQEEEAAYWQARLSRQALQDMKTMGTISQGSAEAITQMLRELGTHGDALKVDDLQALSKLG